MIPNNPCNPASSIFCKPLEEMKKKVMELEEGAWRLHSYNGNEFSSLQCYFSRPPASEAPGCLFKMQIPGPNPEPLILISWGWDTGICILNKFLYTLNV